MLDIPQIKTEFIRLFKEKIHREGADRLLDYLEKSDFFTAPASSRYHLAEEGGLAQHSLNVFRLLTSTAESETYSRYGWKFTEETLAIVALLHDICKIGVYKESTRNVKKNGQWETVPYYEFDDPIPYGHGEKSVYIISSFMKLTREEAFAIRYHMGFSDESSDSRNVGKAFKQYPLSFLLHCADQQAAFFLERTPSKNIE